MSGLIDAINDSVQERLARFRNRPFLNASMAASALVCLADGEVSFSERTRIDDVLENVGKLRVFDPHVAVDLFNDYVESIRETGGLGREKAMRAVRAMAGNPEDSVFVVRICIALSQADGDFSPVERHQILEICRDLDLDPAQFDLGSA